MVLLLEGNQPPCRVQLQSALTHLLLLKTLISWFSCIIRVAAKLCRKVACQEQDFTPWIQTLNGFSWVFLSYPVPGVPPTLHIVYVSRLKYTRFNSSVHQQRLQALKQVCQISETFKMCTVESRPGPGLKRIAPGYRYQ